MDMRTTLLVLRFHIYLTEKLGIRSPRRNRSWEIMPLGRELFGQCMHHANSRKSEQMDLEH